MSAGRSVNMRWPGLNAPIIRDKQLVKRVELPPDEERQDKLNAIRDAHKSYRALRVSPLERGWTGGKMGGRRVGPPEPYEGEPFENFESIILEHKYVDHMTGVMGRKRSISSLVITGNRNGVFGLGRAKANDSRTAVRKAKNKAGHNLRYFEPSEGLTVYHDFHSVVGNTHLIVRRMPEGAGLRCHRVLTSICQVIGIKDLHCKVARAVNPLHIAQAFILGLEMQQTPQELANKAGFYLVEQRKDRENFPQLLAVPEVPSENKIPPDYHSFLLGGKVEWIKPRKVPHYTRLESHQVSWGCWSNVHVVQAMIIMEVADRKALFRNNHIVLAQLIAEYGHHKSFLNKRRAEIGEEAFKKECLEIDRIVSRES
ncbi:MRPS5 [Cordylochernes scorpioides]|uniref:Small ribosomal subunit protein uS5m n=1 Tax=Cordylochernes scorpioides TaxID=51811 RepID=A0ABY6KPF9_9ARAC|nr:MRPS5 [Cordylochernes scorpioides]